MLNVINAFQPNILFVGMTAPKQEKWAYQHKDLLDVNIIASIGAVFDFYAGTVKRAPKWMQNIGLEWLHRSLSSPSRLGKRNMMSNPEFIWDVFKSKIKGNK
jgi:N-acetylglucosaminyldiphosphoundecaprenol N-acetyl-beta-D-mannosaminyltransferase